MIATIQYDVYFFVILGVTVAFTFGAAICPNNRESLAFLRIVAVALFVLLLLLWVLLDPKRIPSVDGSAVKTVSAVKLFAAGVPDALR